MPVAARKINGKWVIVEKATGKVVGHSSNEKDAKSSARARNASKHGWKPSRVNVR